MTERIGRQARNPLVWIWLVGFGFVILQVAVMDMDRWLAWDEAVYYSQGNPNIHALDFSAHRSRGIPWLVAPVLLFTDSILAMRLYLVAISSVGLAVVFTIWHRSIAWGAVGAAALFSASWLAFTYGSELMPNLFSALAAMAALGLAIEYQLKPSKWLSVGVFIASGLTTLIRPLDGAVLVLAIGISVLVLRSSGFVRALGTAALGALVLGIVPWVIESWARFGNPLERLEHVRRLVGSGLTNNLETYAQMLAAPLTSGTFAAAGWQVASWLMILVALSVSGIAMQASGKQGVASIALSTAALMAMPYLFYSEAAAPRFMSPAIGFLSISAGIGVHAIFLSMKQRTLALAWAGALAGLIFAILMTVQISIGLRWSAFQTETRIVSVTLADALAKAAGNQPCFFLSSSGYPQVAVRSGCQGGRLLPDAIDNLSVLAKRQGQGDMVFALVASNEPVESLDGSWSCSKVASLPDTRWHLCENTQGIRSDDALILGSTEI